MRALIRAAALTAAIAAAALAVPFSSGTAVAAPAASTPPAVSNLRTCVAQTGRLDVLFLIDMSGSLQGTDPRAQRVTGISAALTGLDRLTEAGAGAPKVNVLMMGFASTVQTAPSFDTKKTDPFQPVTATTTPGLIREAGDFASRNNQGGTDYKVALAAARTALANQSATESNDGAAPCQAVVFFTDGEYAPPGGAAAAQTGRHAMCDPGGINDSLRADGVTMFSVALSSELNAGDVAFLQGLTEGAGASKCGTKASTANGYLVTAGNGDSLAFLFGDLFTSDATAPAKLPGTFEIEQGVDGLLIRVAVDNAGGAITITPPQGAPYTVQAGTAGTGQVGGFSVTANSLSTSYVEISGTASGPVSAGKWQVQAPGSGSLYSVALSSSAKPSITGATPVVHPGTPLSVPLALTLASGAALTQGPLASGAAIQATLQENGTGSTISVPVTKTASGFSASIQIPTTSTAASYVVTAKAVLPDLGGIPVSAGTSVFTFQRGLVAGPTLKTEGDAAPTLAFGKLEGTSPATGTLTFQGDPNIGGCVWLTDIKPVAPQEAGTPVVDPDYPSSQSNCVQVLPGATASTSVTLHSERAAFGKLTGTATVHILPAGAPKDQTLVVPITGRLDVPANLAKAFSIFAYLLVAGILIPLIILHLLNRRVARFSPAERLLKWDGDVRVQSGGVTLASNRHEPASPGLGSFAYAGEGEGGAFEPARHMAISGIDFVAVPSASWRDRTIRLFPGPYGTAEASGLVAGSAGGRYRRAGRGNRIEVPLTVAPSWFFIPKSQPETGVTQGVLTIVLADAATEDDLKAVISGMNQTLPTVAFPIAPMKPTPDAVDSDSSLTNSDTLDDPL